ncbi:unnamed protein product [Closterium sp. NIES-53]
MCTRMGRHLATFTGLPGSSPYTLATEPPQVAASAQVSASGPVAPPCSCRLCRTRPSRGITALITPPCHAFVACTLASLFLVFPRLCLPSRPRLPRPAFLASRGGSDHERYFLLVVDDNTRYTTVRSLRGGEFSSDLLRDFCPGEGILQSFTLPASPQQNGIAERLHDPCGCSPFSVAVCGPIYHPTSHRVLSSQDVMFDESVPFYHPPPVDPLPPKGPVRSGVSQVDPISGTVPAEPGGAEPAGAEPGGSESEGAGCKGAEPYGVETGGTKPAGVEPGGAESAGEETGGAELERSEPRGTLSTGGPPGASSRWEPLSPSQLHEWFTRRTRLRSGAARAGGARTGGTGAAGAGGAADDGAGDPGAGDPGAGGAGPGGVGAVGAGFGDNGRPRPYFVSLLQQVLGLPSSTGLAPPLLCPLPDQSQPPLYLASPLPAPSPYTEKTGGLRKQREPVSHHASPVRAVRTGRRVPCPRPPPAPARTIWHFSGAASALVAELVDFAAACRLDYAASLVAECESDCPLSIRGECAIRTDILEDRQEDFECFAAVVRHLVSMLIAPEGDPDAPDIPTPRSYAEAITGPYSS